MVADKMRKLKFKSRDLLILSLCAIILAGGILVSFRKGSRRQTIDSSPRKFMEAMDFSLPDLTDNRVSLSDFRNKVVLLTFWTTWCPPCIKEIAILKEIYARYRVIGTPTDIIIDQKGNVRYYNFYWPGNIKEVIEGLLTKQSSK